MSESPEPELRAEIRRQGQRYVSFITTETGKLILQHEFQHDPTGLTYLGPPWAIDQSSLEPSELRQLGLRQTRYWNRTQAAARGWRLFHYLFGNGKALETYRREHPGYASCPLVLTISPEASALWRQPWEYLYNGKDFVCLTGQMPVIRRPPGIRTLAPRVSDPPLRVLVLVATPHGQPEVDIDGEIACLHHALNNAVAKGQLELDILAEPTVVTLRNAFQERRYQVLHYVGHACIDPTNQLAHLCLESQLAQAELVTGQYLARALRGWAPVAAVMAACQSARFGTLEAFTGVAQDTLAGGLPSVVTLPVRLPQETLTVFYAAFYEALANGIPLRDSLQRGRSALAAEIGPEQSGHFAWGVPALYHRATNQPVIYRSKTSTSMLIRASVSRELASPAVAGWRAQFLTARRALEENARVLYIWGTPGVGKRAFLSQLWRDLSPKPLARLQIRCSDMIDPLIVLSKIATFWRENLPDGTGKTAAELLLDASQDPFTRAQQAQQLLASKRLLMILEALSLRINDAAQETHDILEQILLGLMSVPSRTTFLCTSSHPWSALSELAGETECEIYLPLLGLQPALHVMNHLQHLRRISLEDKEKLFRIVGGHAESLILLNGWITLGLDLDQFLESPPVIAPSPTAWAGYLSAQLIDSLDPGELQTLHVVSVLRLPFDAEDLVGLTSVAPYQADRMLERWHRIGLIEPAGLREHFLIRPTIRMAVFDRLSDLDLQDLHRRASEYYGAPFVERARRQIVNRNLTHWSAEDVGWLARDSHGVLGSQLRAEQGDAQFDHLLERVLAWHHHLVASGEINAAVQIARTLAPELSRRGLQDLAHGFFTQASSLATSDKFQTQIVMLDQLQTEEQSLSAALQVYEEIQDLLDDEHLEVQRAYVLLRAGDAHRRLGNLQAAAERYQIALQLMRQAEDREGAAQCLRRLAALHRETGDLRQALVATQAAKEQYEALSSLYGLATVEQDRGYILSELGQPERAIECFTASLRLCRKLADEECVAENLRQIGTLLGGLGRLDIGIQVLEEAYRHYVHLNSPEQIEVRTQLEALQDRRRKLARALQRLREIRQART